MCERTNNLPGKLGHWNTDLYVLNLGLQACVNYALKQLASVGVYMYIDAGHAGKARYT